MQKTIYLNLEDDIAKITARLKRETAPEIVLVCPRKSYIFSDSINLRLLKKQIDVLGKEVSILTMDELGQVYAKEAGFPLKFLTQKAVARGFSDIRMTNLSTVTEEPEEVAIAQQDPGRETNHDDLDPVPDALPATATRNNRTALRQSSPSLQVWDTVFAQPHETDNELSPRSQTRRRPARTISSSAHPQSYKKFMVGFVASALILIVVLVLFILPKAEIVVYAKTQAVVRDVDISMATAIEKPDSAKLVMPTVKVSTVVEQKGAFTSSGKKEVGSKSEGRVQIYNLTGKTLNLKAATTTMTIGNKTYAFKQDQLNIKPIASKDVDPKTLPVAEVVATSGGDDSNVPAGTRMEITNQVFGSKPQFLYAKTETAIVGGNSRFLSVVSVDDIKTAQDSLVTAALEGYRGQLELKHLTLIDKAYAAEISNFTTDKPAGSEVPSFEASLSLTVSGLAFDAGGLGSLIRERIALSLDSGVVLDDQTQDTANVRVKDFDAANGVLHVSVHYESKAIWTIDASGIIPKILGKTKQQASEVLLAQSSIERVDIALSPSWQNSVPRFAQKVELEVQQ